MLRWREALSGAAPGTGVFAGDAELADRLSEFEDDGMEVVGAFGSAADARPALSATCPPSALTSSCHRVEAGRVLAGLGVAMPAIAALMSVTWRTMLPIESCVRPTI